MPSTAFGQHCPTADLWSHLQISWTPHRRKQRKEHHREEGGLVPTPENRYLSASTIAQQHHTHITGIKIHRVVPPLLPCMCREAMPPTVNISRLSNRHRDSLWMWSKEPATASHTVQRVSHTEMPQLNRMSHTCPPPKILKKQYTSGRPDRKTHSNSFFQQYLFLMFSLHHRRGPFLLFFFLSSKSREGGLGGRDSACFLHSKNSPSKNVSPGNSVLSEHLSPFENLLCVVPACPAKEGVLHTASRERDL